MFTFNLSDKLSKDVDKLYKKDSVMALALKKKIDEIVACDETSIDHYKDSKYEMAKYKHVHIASSFVLFFQVFKKEKHILFIKLVHHDKAFRR